MHKPGRPSPISHTQMPRLPIKTVRHRSNMTFLPEGWVCLMMNGVIWNVYKVHGRQLLKLGFSTIYNQNYLRLHLSKQNVQCTQFLVYPTPIHNAIRKLYVSKMNENKEIIPTNYTRNPPESRPPTPSPDNNTPPPNTAARLHYWSHAILMVPVLLAHMLVLSMICKI